MNAFNFNARQVAPNQTPPVMPAGRYRVIIESSDLKQTKAGDGGYVSLMIKSIDTVSGKVQHNLNIYNKSAQTVQIAFEQLSAICHAINVLDVVAQDNSPGNYLPMLHNIPFMADITVDGEYNRVRKVYDANGNEPGQVPSGPQGAPAPAPVTPPQQAWAPPTGQPAAPPAYDPNQAPQQQWAPPPQQQQAPQQHAPAPQQSWAPPATQPPQQQQQQQQPPQQQAWAPPATQQPTQPPQQNWQAPPQQGQPPAPGSAAPPPGWAR
jgi:hypothetical protein